MINKRMKKKEILNLEDEIKIFKKEKKKGGKEKKKTRNL